jgi:signal peptidase I
MRKKKFPLTALAIICGTIIGLLIVARLTGAIALFKQPTGANDPAIKVGDQFLSTNLKTPKLFDFITFHHTNEREGKHMRVYRVCGMPGDKLQIKDGDLYINGQFADGPLNLKQLYRIADTSMITVAERFQLEDSDNAPIQTDSGKAIVFLSKEQAKELQTLKIPCKRYPNFDNEVYEQIEEQFHQRWTTDNFGPVQVPAGHYFVLGDNRNMAEDSRFTGFIKKEDVYGVVLGVK